MIQYLDKVKTLAKSFKEFSIKQIPQSENKKADALSKIASTSFAHLNKQVLVEELKEKSINEKEILNVVEEEGTLGRRPLRNTCKEIPPEDKKERPERTSKIAAWYDMIQWNPIQECEKQCIRQCFASVKHPQANGLVERANRSLGEGIKARLDERSKDWIEELPHVLWAHRTMIKSSNGETPFSLTYGTEAVIPAEIGMPTFRTAEMDPTKNNEALGINLDLIEERREQAAQVSSRAIWSTAAMKQVMPGTKASLDPSGKDRTKLKNRLEMELTNSKTAKGMKCRGHGTFVISKSVIYMKCKNSPGTYDAPEGNIFIYLHLVIL
ncbi:reverse transcriptase domain-containing protein [Tanacetum coccineum]|uniref:Reverse transcriptase domain-containing protein n=1 Tax=Tanacetum coccineum TaxID=301880 RepID=A0ABQ4YR43_9ASTR